MNQALLIKVLRQPEIVAGFSEKDWDILLRQSKAANLTARTAQIFQQHKLHEHVPEDVLRHFLSAQKVTERQRKTVLWEVKLLDIALQSLSVPVILLKGGAYLASGFEFANNRLFSDIDIMVPKAALDDVEQTLFHHQWRSSHTNAYDQKYYRKWMHELPPMSHVERKTSLDIHHTILPPTSGIRPSPEKLLENSIKVDGYENVYHLSPVDMLLHSMTHLFFEGEFRNGLRDLCDIQSMIELNVGKKDFWQVLVQRSKELGLQRQLFYGLYFSGKILQLKVPESVLKQTGVRVPKILGLMFEEVLSPHHETTDSVMSGFFRWMLFVRGHYLRMPLYLLIPHLLRKALIPEQDEDRWAKEFLKQLEK